ncbi:ATP-binding protein [Pectobacterium atrosepticum]|uniref:ATP-binding protein n=1 Tax=Pectobacterium atrosepticum TaxID=29471 RepID=UPI000C2923E8|nr:ATP-binding protein [Pectobacterium atrosepticum]ATY89862.1 ATP-binding protein [Pectobacterium atrosepticum]MCA6980418.1 ATP-binding protein [Pectobacterium atrosepticum]MCH5021594.1 ATP-binding protein [Pectobacterium atrosepticum]
MGNKSKASLRGNRDSGKTSVVDLRIYCVSARFNKVELEYLNSRRGNKSKGEWLRIASLNQFPPVVPSINVDAWKFLGLISQQFNHVISHLKSKSIESGLTKTEIFFVKKTINELRTNLLSISIQGASYEGNAEDKTG